MISPSGTCSLTNGFFSMFQNIQLGSTIILDNNVSSFKKKHATIKIKNFLFKDKKDKGKITIFSFNGVDLEP